MKSRSERFKLGLRMLAESERAEVMEQIERELPEPQGAKRRRKGHNHLLHTPDRRCNGCKLEILGNVAADLGRLDVVRVAN
jgi:hypothetical protein